MLSIDTLTPSRVIRLSAIILGFSVSTIMPSGLSAIKVSIGIRSTFPLEFNRQKCPSNINRFDSAFRLLIASIKCC